MRFKKGDIILYINGGNPRSFVSSWEGRLGIVIDDRTETLERGYERIGVRFREDMFVWNCDINNLLKIGE